MLYIQTFLKIISPHDQGEPFRRVQPKGMGKHHAASGERSEKLRGVGMRCAVPSRRKAARNRWGDLLGNAEA